MAQSTVAAHENDEAPAPVGTRSDPGPVQTAGAFPTQSISNSLYVGDLDSSVTEDQLYELFNQAGQVVSIKLRCDPVNKKSLGYAFVHFQHGLEASRALESLNFTTLNGKSIRIMYYSNRDRSIRNSEAANIFIRNLEKGIDNKILHDTFSVFGPILSSRVAVDEAGTSKGYGYVQFEQEESAQRAIEKMNGMPIREKRVSVGPFVNRHDRELRISDHGSKFTNVFVKNIADATSDGDFKEVFDSFGPITSAAIMRDSNGKSKCFGFANFENADDAAKAVESLNGKRIGGDKEWYVGRAQKKAERETELKAKFEQLSVIDAPAPPPPSPPASAPSPPPGLWPAPVVGHEQVFYAEPPGLIMSSHLNPFDQYHPYMVPQMFMPLLESSAGWQGQRPQRERRNYMQGNPRASALLQLNQQGALLSEQNMVSRGGGNRDVNLDGFRQENIDQYITGGSTPSRSQVDMGFMPTSQATDRRAARRFRGQSAGSDEEQARF